MKRFYTYILRKSFLIYIPKDKKDCSDDFLLNDTVLLSKKNLSTILKTIKNL